MAIRVLSLITQALVDPGKPSQDARLMNLAMKAILVVSLVALVSSVIVYAYLAEWHVPVGSDNGGVEPNVQLSNAYAWGGNEWGVEIAGVSEARDLDNWRAVLLKDGVVQDDMDPLSDGFSTRMDFIDIGGEGRLTSGDFFIITCDQGSSYQLSIIWKSSGNVKGSESWET